MTAPSIEQLLDMVDEVHHVTADLQVQEYDPDKPIPDAYARALEAKIDKIMGVERPPEKPPVIDPPKPPLKPEGSSTDEHSGGSKSDSGA